MKTVRLGAIIFGTDLPSKEETEVEGIYLENSGSQSRDYSARKLKVKMPLELSFLHKFSILVYRSVLKLPSPSNVTRIKVVEIGY